MYVACTWLPSGRSALPNGASRVLHLHLTAKKYKRGHPSVTSLGLAFTQCLEKLNILMAYLLLIHCIRPFIYNSTLNNSAWNYYSVAIYVVFINIMLT